MSWEIELTEADYATLRDMGMLPPVAVVFPPPEPSVPSCYWDCYHPTTAVGYSDMPDGSRVVPLSRERYPTLKEAEHRFEELKERNSWSVYSRFLTARYWCWRITERDEDGPRRVLGDCPESGRGSEALP